MPWPFDTTRVVEAAPALEFVLPPGASDLTLESKVIATISLFLVCCVLPFSHLSQNKALGDDSNVLAVVVIGYHHPFHRRTALAPAILVFQWLN